MESRAQTVHHPQERSEVEHWSAEEGRWVNGVVAPVQVLFYCFYFLSTNKQDHQPIRRGWGTPVSF